MSRKLNILFLLFTFLILLPRAAYAWGPPLWFFVSPFIALIAVVGAVIFLIVMRLKKKPLSKVTVGLLLLVAIPAACFLVWFLPFGSALFESFIGSRFGRSALVDAASLGKTEEVRALLDKGHDVNKPNKLGHTALGQAVSNGRMSTVKLLIGKGADVNAAEKYTGTPLMHAVRNGKADMVNLLLENGADVNAVNHIGGTALFEAVWHDTELINILINNGANVNVQRIDQDKDTPLTHALKYEKCEAAKLLLERGADLNIRDNLGRTPLMRISDSKCNQKEIIKIMIKKGVDLNAKDKNGATALTYAKTRGDQDVIKLLKQAGAKE